MRTFHGFWWRYNPAMWFATCMPAWYRNHNKPLKVYERITVAETVTVAIA